MKAIGAVLMWLIIVFDVAGQQKKTIALDTVIIKEKRQRIVISGDTLIIRTGDLELKPHADASEIFNEITGLSINDGAVMIMGKYVSELLVDGRRIFGGVPSITLNNLKASMIQQIEVIEKVNEFGHTEKKINLKLKPDKSQGGFGDITAGIGDNQRYLSKAKYNELSPKSYTNFFANTNNLNEFALDPKDLARIISTQIRNQVSSFSITGLYDAGTTTINDINDNETLQNKSGGIRKSNAAGGSYSVSKNQNELNVFALLNHHKNSIVEVQNTKTFWENVEQNTAAQSYSDGGNTNLSYFANGKSQIHKKVMFKFKHQLSVEKNSLQDSTNNVITINQILQQNHAAKRANGSFYVNDIQALMNFQSDKKGVNTSLFCSAKNSFQQQGIIFNTGNESFNKIQKRTLDNNQQLKYFNVELIQSYPLSKRVLIEAKASHLFQQFMGTQQAKAMYENGFDLKNKKDEVGVNFLLQNRKWSVVLSASAMSYSSLRQLNGQEIYVVGTVPNFMNRINFRINNQSNCSLKFQRKTTLPSESAIFMLPDSSNLSRIKRPNPQLLPYTDNSVIFLVSHLLRKVYNVSVTVTSSVFSNHAIPNTIFDNGAIYNDIQNSQFLTNQSSVNYAIIQLFSKNKLSFSSYGSFSLTNSYSIINNQYSPFSMKYFFASCDALYKFSNQNTLKMAYQSQANWVGNNANFLNVILLKHNHSFRKRWYAEHNFRLLASSNIKLYLDAECERYVLKNNVLRISGAVKNLLNTTTNVAVKTEGNSQATLNTNYLPRLFMVSATLFFENWKKK
jgi:hypothetical protein